MKALLALILSVMLTTASTAGPTAHDPNQIAVEQISTAMDLHQAGRDPDAVKLALVALATKDISNNTKATGLLVIAASALSSHRFDAARLAYANILAMKSVDKEFIEAAQLGNRVLAEIIAAETQRRFPLRKA